MTPTEEPRPGGGLRPLGWLGFAAIAVVIVVNVAGIVGIALARRAVREDARQHFELELSGRVRELGVRLAGTRADLAFLAGSSAFSGVDLGRLGSAPEPSREDEEALRAVEGALLIFMRGHPEVERIALFAEDGTPVAAANRRGGVPLVSVGPDTAEPLNRKPVNLDRGRIRTLISLAPLPETGRPGGRLQATIAAPDLLATLGGSGDHAISCAIRDVDGNWLAADTTRAAVEPPQAERDGWMLGAVALDTRSWASPARWEIACAERRESTLGFIAPLARTYRWTLFLNLFVMALAVGLGWFALRQTRRRLELEASARESERVRHLERQLHHSERLRTVGRLAAGIAHEINNPLAGMSNYLTLAQDDLERGDAPSALKRLAEVRSGLEGAAGIVRRVLSHADPTAPSHEVLDLREPLEQALRWVRTRREFGTIRFALEGMERPLTVRANPVQLGQVFLNLFLNACEVQPGGGRVVVCADRGDGTAEVTVADDGPGIPAEDRVTVFEPFYSTKGGTGLGLSVCYGIVEEHGGSLSVESAESGGALFRLRLPLHETGGDPS